MTTLSDTPGEGLAPCPFCGGKPYLTNGGPGNHYVKCDGCRASSDDGSIEYAVEYWNRRSPSVASDTAALPSDHAGLVDAATLLLSEIDSAGGLDDVIGATGPLREAIAALGRVQPVAQLGGAPDDLRNLIKVVFAGYTIEQMNAVCKDVLARRDPSLAALGRVQPVAVKAWRCADCGCHSHARVDERSPEGGFRPGPQVRCENCKDVSTYPDTPPAPQPALALIEELTGALSNIAHTFTEDSHGNSKTMPSHYYQDIARTALASAKRFKGE